MESKDNSFYDIDDIDYVIRVMEDYERKKNDPFASIFKTFEMPTYVKIEEQEKRKKQEDSEDEFESKEDTLDKSFRELNKLVRSIGDIPLPDETKTQMILNDTYRTLNGEALYRESNRRGPVSHLKKKKHKIKKERNYFDVGSSYIPSGSFEDTKAFETLFKIITATMVVGAIALGVIEKSLDKNKLQNDSPRENPKKHEYTENKNTIFNSEIFRIKEDGTVTNVLSSDIYKEFEDYARSNDLIMNAENFENFCDMYYGDDIVSRGGR